jgi:hypothetical protein
MIVNQRPFRQRRAALRSPVAALLAQPPRGEARESGAGKYRAGRGGSTDSRCARRWLHILIAARIFASLVSGHSHYQDSIPNGRHVPGVPGGPAAWHAVGHVAPNPASHPTYILGGFPRSSFGHDFAAAGHRWTRELCRRDSDDDGRSNGDELGDPHCVWRPGDTPTRSTNLSHPGLHPKQLAEWSTAALERGRTERAAHTSGAVHDAATRSGWRNGGVVYEPFTSALCTSARLQPATEQPRWLLPLLGCDGIADCCSPIAGSNPAMVPP